MLIYILNCVGFLLITVGLTVILVGSIGLWRFKGVFNKIHAASLIDSFGLPLSILGLSLLQNNMIAFCKLFFILILVFLLSPTSTHALALLAYQSKQSFKEDQDKYKLP